LLEWHITLPLYQGYNLEIFKYRPYSHQIYISEIPVILSTKPSHVLLTYFTTLKYLLQVHSRFSSWGHSNS